MVKKGGFGEIIPRFQVVVFDEAHSIEDIATSYFGESFSTNQLTELVKDLEKEVKAHGNKVEKELKRHLDLIRTGAEGLREPFAGSKEKGRLKDEILEKIHTGLGRDIRGSLKFISEESDLKSLKSAALQAYASRAGELEQRLEHVLSSTAPDWLQWYERRRKGVVLHASPLDVSQYLEEYLYLEGRSTVFTSATLSTNGDFSYYRSRMGLSEDVLEKVYTSHFFFQEQTLMYIPKDLPLPSHPDFGLGAAKRILDILKITSGRALVLFTSYHNLNLVHQFLER